MTVITAHYSLTAATDGGASGGLGNQELSQQYPLVQCGAFVSFMIDYSLGFARIIWLCVLQSHVVPWHPRGFQHLCFKKKRKEKPHTCIHQCTASSIIIWVYGKILLCILVIKPRKQNVNHSIGTNFVPLLIQRCLNLLLLLLLLFN